MIDEPSEIWERHIEELLDKKLKPIKREIKQLKQAHDAVTSQHAKILLETQQAVAALKIDDFTNISCSIIQNTDNIRHSQKLSLRTQIIADAASAKSNVWNSNKPYDVLTTYREKWLQTLRDLGCEVITF